MHARQAMLTRLLAGLCLLALAGCRAHVQRALLADRPSPHHHEEIAANYQVGCPDELHITVVSLPHSRSFRQSLAPDGRIDLGNLGQPRVEGKTAAEITSEIARLAKVPPGNVSVRVAGYRSKQVYLFGQVSGLQRAVAYQGPETVLDLLRRAGGISAGAELEEVYVVRSNVAEGGRPEVLPVELKDIVILGDQKSNVRIEPFDQVYIGETKRSRLQKAVPPLLKPVYGWLTGMSWGPPDPKSPAQSAPGPEIANPR
jgi:protein involved in polysaccharide export with SLBB domain